MRIHVFSVINLSKFKVNERQANPPAVSALQGSTATSRGQPSRPVGGFPTGVLQWRGEEEHPSRCCRDVTAIFSPASSVQQLFSGRLLSACSSYFQPPAKTLSSSSDELFIQTAHSCRPVRPVLTLTSSTSDGLMTIRTGPRSHGFHLGSSVHGGVSVTPTPA